MAKVDSASVCDRCNYSSLWSLKGHVCVRTVKGGVLYSVQDQPDFMNNDCVGMFPVRADCIRLNECGVNTCKDRWKLRNQRV